MPKAVHRSGCRDKHNWLQPLTPQSIMPSLNHCDLLRHVGVNNLPKVVTRQCRCRELNLQPASCKSNALATRLPSHLYRSRSKVKVIAQSSRSNEVKCCQSGRYDLKQGLSSYNYYFIPSGFIPCSRHLLYRQAWHAFRLFRVISH